jgi:hypothetical protein
MKRPSPAMIVALTALVFSMGGTAIAAKHYLITSTSQIKPSVLRTLEKRLNPNPQVGASVGAPTGATGSAGATGPEGKQGAPGIGVTVIGPPGLQGNEGLRGPPGLEGKTGETGSAFAQGAYLRRNERAPHAWRTPQGRDGGSLHGSVTAGRWRLHDRTVRACVRLRTEPREPRMERGGDQRRRERSLRHHLRRLRRIARCR